MSGECSTCSAAGTCSTGNVAVQEELTAAQKDNRVRKVLAVVSGKGGVGKSSVTALLASSLQRQGKKVGILDADITGPSIPKMFGLRERTFGNQTGILPATSRYGIKVMSLNLLLESEDDPVIWRGSIITQVVKQFWKDVVWGELDYLLIDLPPGTGDVPITVFQSFPVNGVVVVTSPQQLAGMIVRKTIKMAGKYEIPIVGLIENMAYIECPDCHRRIELFGPPRGKEEARQSEIAYLGELPIDPDLTGLADRGLVEEYRSAAVDRLAAHLITEE